jgi:16S rRNA (cytosine967-C5)-methyltransferase
MAWNGVQVFATDRNEHRIPLLKQTIERAAPQIQLMNWDLVEQMGQKDWIWLDAPCSGTGILRRHPDVRWLRQEKELIGLQQTQEELFKKAWSQVSPSGFLVYSVCSVLKGEGPGLLQRMNVKGSVLKSWFLSPQDSPHGDGFWAALLQK